MFYGDSTVRYSETQGFGESYHITCPVCWNSSIRMTQWEDGTFDCKECVTCWRMEEVMELESLMKL